MERSQKSRSLRALVSERLSAAAEEIFALVERTISEYEEELCRCRDENQRNQQLLQENQRNQQLLREVLQAQTHTEARSEIQIRPESQEEAEQQEQESAAIKDEPEEMCIDQNICVKTEEPSLQQTVVKEERPKGEQSRGAAERVRSCPQQTPHREADMNHREAEMSQRGAEEQRRGTEKSHRGADMNHREAEMSQRGAEKSHRGADMNHRGAETNYSLQNKRLASENCKIETKLFVSPLNQFRVRQDMSTNVQNSNLFCKVGNGAEITARHAQGHTEGPLKSQKYIFTVTESRQMRLTAAHSSSRVGVKSLSDNTVCSNSNKVHKCSYCEKRFSTNQSLQIHIRVHTGEKPYRCPVCEKCFKQRAHLNTHIRTHTKEKPFSCSVCLKSFMHKVSLNLHVEKTHPDHVG